MEEWGLSTAGVQVGADHPTGRVTATVEDGSPSFDIGEGQAWDFIASEAALEAVEGETVALLYHGTLATRGAASAATLHALLDATEAQTFVDVNLRDPWWTRERVLWSLANASWVKLSDEELAALSGQPTEGLAPCRHALLSFARRHSLPRVVVTRGAAGAVTAIDARDVVVTEAPHVEDVVDTVGAGDALSAVLCLGVLRRWGIEETLDRAVSFAGEICRIRGATTGDTALYDAHRHPAEPTPPSAAADDDGLYVMGLSLHGLVRGKDLELGRDADTGGQTSYVVDQARALAEHPDVGRVELITRQVFDAKVDATYGEGSEEIAPNSRIVRVPFGPRRYLRKESLWPHLDSALDQLTRYLRAQRRVPDVIHGHYADAGYVGAQLSKLLGVPFVFTGHSLGRVKRARLLDDGRDPDALEARYRLSQRIEAEERALETAALVLTSTTQEVREQYEPYDHYEPGRMHVIPPGVDVTRFSPPTDPWKEPPVSGRLAGFLRKPERPMVLALARPDERKNFSGLVRAFGETPGLREKANLVLIAGTREDIDELPRAVQRVLMGILRLVDRYDLYGSVAYPKRHDADDIPDLFRLAVRSGGVFVNPALTEPFGLTLIEAAASGLPVVATRDGGPRDIVAECDNGLLVDPLDTEGMGRAILEAISDGDRWTRWSRNGVRGVHRGFTWKSHADRYVGEVRKVTKRPSALRRRGGGSRLPRIDRLLITDVDDTLTGDPAALQALLGALEEAGSYVGFGLATGRPLGAAMDAISELELPAPDVLITASGTELHYGARLTRDRSWEHQIRYRWDPVSVQAALASVPGCRPGGGDDISPYRLRYEVDPEEAPSVPAVRRLLRQAGLQASLIVDHDRHMDVLPVRASPGTAIRFLLFKWNLSPERLLVAGDSGNDADMLSGDTLGVVVANHTGELESLRGRPRVFFAAASHAWGVLEGVEWYDFFGRIRVPDDPEAPIPGP